MKYKKKKKKCTLWNSSSPKESIINLTEKISLQKRHQKHKCIEYI